MHNFINKGSDEVTTCTTAAIFKTIYETDIKKGILW